MTSQWGFSSLVYFLTFCLAFGLSLGTHLSNLLCLSLTLYQFSDRPPELVVQQAQPEHVVVQPLGGLELMGYDLEDDKVSQGGRLHLTLYWRVRKPERILIATLLGDTALEAHDQHRPRDDTLLRFSSLYSASECS